jgi:C-terminal processing protease CtpA/Prc
MRQQQKNSGDYCRSSIRISGILISLSSTVQKYTRSDRLEKDREKKNKKKRHLSQKDIPSVIIVDKRSSSTNQWC